jgi:hypothetical protein
MQSVCGYPGTAAAPSPDLIDRDFTPVAAARAQVA